MVKISGVKYFKLHLVQCQVATASEIGRWQATFSVQAERV